MIAGALDVVNVEEVKLEEFKPDVKLAGTEGTTSDKDGSEEGTATDSVDGGMTKDFSGITEVTAATSTSRFSVVVAAAEALVRSPLL